MKEPRLVLFDGNAILHRAFHALPPLAVSKTGEMAGAVYGFTQTLLKVIGELKPSHYAIAFDRAAPTFRHEMFAEYKAHRPKTPDELVNQLGRVRELVEAFNMPVFELDGYEADDILGTLSRQAREQGLETVIVTGDKDIMQLVKPEVKVYYYNPRGKSGETVLYDETEVARKEGVKPEQIADLKGLEGDPSDNIPGVRGIGEKTAQKLIRQFGSIEGIYAHLDEVSPAKLKANLEANREVALKSKELATIATDAPITLDPAECRAGRFDRGRLAAFFRELEFHSLLNRLPEINGAGTPAAIRDDVVARTSYQVVSREAAFEELLACLGRSRAFAFDLETTGLDPMSARLVGISLALGPGKAYYIPVGHTDAAEQLPLPMVVARLKAIMANRDIAKLAHNAKYDMAVFGNYGVEVANLSLDTMLAAHLLGEKAISLKALAFSRLGIEMTQITELIGKGAKQISMAEVEVEKAAGYAAADADATLRLGEIFEKELKEQALWSLYTEVELPLVPVLIRVERNGIALDTALLGELSRKLAEQLKKLEEAIYQWAGHHFNINSPRQLADLLFKELKLPPTRQTRGAYTTGAQELEALREVHPIIAPILDYRQLTKLKSTYLDALPGLINPETGRLHTSFNQTKTTTGRLSSSEPNLQNIPVRGETGRQVRKAFVAPTGSYLLAGDYSQIDLRALAHLSGDENLIAAFKYNEDIHAATASRLFGVKGPEVTADMRRLAKTVNFGVIYGMSEYGLEQATELSRGEASQFISAYFEKYPGVTAYLEATKRQAREKGYVKTLLGRRRYIPEINAQNRQVREAAERMAINMPVQGTSADIIKVAMVNLDREMTKRGLKSQMLLQVHDELILEVPQAELELMRRLVPEVMASALLLSVPLRVDIKLGRNWEEME